MTPIPLRLAPTRPPPNRFIIDYNFQLMLLHSSPVFLLFLLLPHRCNECINVAQTNSTRSAVSSSAVSSSRNMGLKEKYKASLVLRKLCDRRRNEDEGSDTDWYITSQTDPLPPPSQHHHIVFFFIISRCVCCSSWDATSSSDFFSFILLAHNDNDEFETT